MDVVPSTPVPSPPTQRATQVSSLLSRPLSGRERHASAPLGTSPSASPIARRHSLAITRASTPKPNQWPMADQQLRRFSSSGMSGDPSMTPGKTARIVERFQQQQTAPLILAQDSLNKRQLERKLSTGSGIIQSLSSSSVSSSLKLALPHTGQALPTSLDLDLRMTPEEVLEEMELFAVQAEESARQARQLADWAASIVSHIKNEEGTSVDTATPIQPNHSSSEEDEKSAEEHRQSSGVLGDVKCILM